MTIEQALKEYEEGKGKPGKFEAESAETYYYYDKSMEGFGDFCEKATCWSGCDCNCHESEKQCSSCKNSHSSNCETFKVTEDEAVAFQLDKDKLIHLYQDDNGFVYTFQE